MILKGLDNVSIDRAVRLVTQKTEATYKNPTSFKVCKPNMNHNPLKSKGKKTNWLISSC